jgi:hypothetical protein
LIFSGWNLTADCAGADFWVWAQAAVAPRPVSGNAQPAIPNNMTTNLFTVLSFDKKMV